MQKKLKLVKTFIDTDFNKKIRQQIYRKKLIPKQSINRNDYLMCDVVLKSGISLHIMVWHNRTKPYWHKTNKVKKFPNGREFRLTTRGPDTMWVIWNNEKIVVDLTWVADWSDNWQGMFTIKGVKVKVRLRYNKEWEAIFTDSEEAIHRIPGKDLWRFGTDETL